MNSLNPRVSLYWLWLAVAFGAIMLVPWHRYSLPGHHRMLPLGTVYVNPGMNWQPVLVVHSAVSVLLAVFATAVHHRVQRTRRKAVPQPLTFSLGRLLAGVAVVGGIFSILTYCGAPPLVFLVVILLVAGHPASLALTALIARGAKRCKDPQ